MFALKVFKNQYYPITNRIEQKLKYFEGWEIGFVNQLYYEVLKYDEKNKKWVLYDENTTSYYECPF